MSRLFRTRIAPIGALVVLGLALAVFVSPAAGSGGSRAGASDVIGPQMGVVWDTTGANPSSSQLGLPSGGLGDVTTLACPDPTCNLTYHGGSLVLGPHTTHVVYWEPTGSSVTRELPLADRAVPDRRRGRQRPRHQRLRDRHAVRGREQQPHPVPADLRRGAHRHDRVPGHGQRLLRSPTVSRTATNCLTQTQEATELDNFIQANSLAARAQSPLLPGPAGQGRDVLRRLLRLRQLPRHQPALLRVPQLLQHQRPRRDALGQRAVHRLRREPLQQRLGARPAERRRDRPRAERRSATSTTRSSPTRTTAAGSTPTAPVRTATSATSTSAPRSPRPRAVTTTS